MSTQINRKNKDVAGFLILNIMAEIDGSFDPREGNVIASYIEEHFPLGGNLETAMEEMSTTSPEDYPLLFQKCAEDFLADSTDQERMKFLDFAMQMMTADDTIDPDENWMINKLYQYWDLG